MYTSSVPLLAIIHKSSKVICISKPDIRPSSCLSSLLQLAAVVTRREKTRRGSFSWDMDGHTIVVQRGHQPNLLSIPFLIISNTAFVSSLLRFSSWSLPRCRLRSSSNASTSADLDRGHEGRTLSIDLVNGTDRPTLLYQHSSLQSILTSS